MNNTIPNKNLTKQEIVLSVFDATKGDIHQNNIRDIVQLTIDAIGLALISGRNVELRNFGVFEVKVSAARTGRDVRQNGRTFIIPRCARVKFKAGRALKAGLKKLPV